MDVCRSYSPGSSTVDLSWLDVSLVLIELDGLSLHISLSYPRAMRTSIKGALTEIVRHLKSEILDAEVWQALAAVDDTLQPPRTFQHALYSAVIGLRLGLEAKTFAGKAEVVRTLSDSLPGEAGVLTSRTVHCR